MASDLGITCLSDIGSDVTNTIIDNAHTVRSTMTREDTLNESISLMGCELAGLTEEEFDDLCDAVSGEAVEALRPRRRHGGLRAQKPSREHDQEHEEAIVHGATRTQEVVQPSDASKGRRHTEKVPVGLKVEVLT